jgi:hypothetical protein
VQRSVGLQFKASLGKQFHKTLSRKTLHKNRTGGVAQGKVPEFKPQYCKKKKKKKRKKKKEEVVILISDKIDYRVNY